MSLRSISLKTAYETDNDDLIADFYVPALSQAVRYDRLAGFFCSSSLAVAAEGIVKLIENKGVMRLVTCPRFSTKDAAEINRATTDAASIISRNFIREFNNLEDGFEKDHVSALGWMLANGYLQMKIAIVQQRDGGVATSEQIDHSAIMHEKVGLIYDADMNAISFSGSNNESASGWQGNIEEFKVFKEWTGEGNGYFHDDVRKFNAFWRNEKKYVSTVDIPDAVRDKLIEAGADFKVENIAITRYYSTRYRTTPVPKKSPLSLFSFQWEALNAWQANDRQLFIEMATGCGKTRTALACLNEVLREHKPLLCVIACPQVTLSRQWQRELNALEICPRSELLLSGSSGNWRAEFKKSVNKLRAGFSKGLVIFATHALACKDDFVDIVRSASRTTTTMIIADEAHGLGAAKQQNALDDSYKYRIGLSATPRRWFDDVGTKRLVDYFGGKSYVFTIAQALSTNNELTKKPFLSRFEYHPHFVKLDEDELTKYRKLTLSIARAAGGSKGSEDTEQLLSRLRFQRANIEKQAESKYPALGHILDQIGHDISDTIIFVSPQQIDRVMQMLSERGIIAHRFTEKQGTTPKPEYGNLSERDHLIAQFKAHEYQILVAIKILDEGIDIPSAKRAIIMASSTNPREYVQRVGRVIRQAPGKSLAYIHDLIIEPDTSGFQDPVFSKLELQIFKKEMDRVLDMSQNAINAASVCKDVYEILGELE